MTYTLTEDLKQEDPKEPRRRQQVQLTTSQQSRRRALVSFPLLALYMMLITCVWGATGCDDDPAPVADSPSMAGNVTPEDDPLVTRGALTIESPRQNMILAERSVIVSGSHSTASEVIINGEMTPVMSQRFSATLTLEDGQHQITVSAGEDEVILNVLVDSTPPEIEITEPRYGAHIDAASDTLVTVVGRVTDAHSGVEDVWVNGQEVFVEANGRFQFIYEPEPGLGRPLARAVDRAGHETTASRGFIYGRLKPWGTPIERGVIGQVSAEGFDVLSTAIEGALLGGLLDELLADNVGVSEDLTVTDVIFQDIDVELTPREGFIFTSVTFSDLRVFFDLNSPSTSGDVYISPARLSAELHLAPKPDGTLDIQILNTDLSLENLNVRVDNSLLDAAVSFIEGFVRDLAEDALLSILEDTLVDELLGPDAFSPSFSLLGVEVEVRALLREVDITSERLKLIAGAQISELPNINDALGYLYLPPNAPPAPLLNMATLDMQLNMLHLFLSHLWRGGLLNFTLEEVLGEPPAMLSGVLLNGFTSGELLERMGPTEIVGVRLRPNLPPVARFDATRRDAIIVDFVDLFIDLMLPGGQVWFTASVDLIATIRPKLTNSQLGLQIELEANASAVDAPLFAVKSVELLNLITTFLESLPGQLGPDGISEFFDLNSSSIYGLTFNSAQVITRDTPTPYAQVGLDLNITP